MKNIALILLFLFPSIHCAQKKEKPVEDKTLESVVSGPHRLEMDRKRDQFRNPVETLKFFEVEPEMSVVEVSPGGGWYTDILAPYLEGTLYVAAFNDKSARQYYRDTNLRLKQKAEKNKKLYGNIKYTVFEMPDDLGPIAPKESVDRVLTFRNVHNWMKAGKAKEAFQEFHRVLKKGGLLGVVEHRANKASKVDPKAESGYAHTQQVIDLAQSAGFKLVAQSEINANPKDTAKHPKGVWTLPPSLKLGKKDQAKYEKIGESDRMTLKFVK